MNLKDAATLAMVGSLLLAGLRAWDVMNVVTGVMRGAIPVLMIPRSLTYLFASICVSIFFYTFSKSQTR